jgi:hypothetical protein
MPHHARAHCRNAALNIRANKLGGAASARFAVELNPKTLSRTITHSPIAFLSKGFAARSPAKKCRLFS